MKSKRHVAILKNLRRQGAATISELATKLDVSEMTVRRDLDELAEHGLLQRTHGGAISLNFMEADPTFSQRRTINQQAKQAIARRAAELVNPGEQIILDSGTTVASICPYLEGKAPLTVITYSLPVAQALIHKSDINLICTGGAGNTATDSFVGPLAERVLAEVRVDKAFIGVSSVSLKEGFSNSHVDNLNLQRKVLEVARETFILADSTKFRRPAFWLVAALSAVSAIITDNGLSPEMATEYEEAGVRVLVAEPTDAEASSSLKIHSEHHNDE